MSRRHPRKPALNENGKKNTRPIVWSEKFVLSEVSGMLAKARKDRSILLLLELFEPKEYTRQRFSEWAKKFEKNDQISDTIRKLEDLLEGRIAKNGLLGKYPPNAFKFVMMNKHGWRDKSDVDNKHEFPTMSKVFEEIERKKKERAAAQEQHDE